MELTQITLLISQKYGGGRHMYYHGTIVPNLQKLYPFAHVGEDVPLVWITNSVRWAEETAFSHYYRTKSFLPVLYLGRLTMDLNIFNARAQSDWDNLITKMSDFKEYEDILKNTDWLRIDWESENLTRGLLIKLISEIGEYDGVFNFEEVDLSPSIGLFSGKGFGIVEEFHYDLRNNLWLSMGVPQHNFKPSVDIALFKSWYGGK
jgi:hypothetical protein